MADKDNGTLVAADSAAQRAAPGFVQNTNVWHLGNPLAAIPADDPARNMFFGSTLEIGFAGLETGMAYELELTFLSDGSDRVVRITANDRDLEPQLALPNGELLRKRWPLPSKILGGGKLVVEVSKIAGPNAVLSGVAVYANKPKAKPLVVLSAGEPAAAVSAVVTGKMVAEQTAAQGRLNSFVQCTNVWKTSAGKAGDPAQSMFFGSAITAGFAGLEAGVAYKLELTFLSDGSDRTVRIAANGRDLEPQLALPNGEVLRKLWLLPNEILAEGELAVEVSTVKGPNAVLSGVAVYANKSDAKPLVVLPPRVSAKMVAYETAELHSLNSFVQCTNTWTMPVVGDQVSASESLREMFFDSDTIKIVFTGAEPSTIYGMELAFLSNCDDRAVRISTGGMVLADKLALPNMRILRKYFPIPPEAIKNDRFEIIIAKVSGPNVILSGISVFANNAKAKALVAPSAKPLSTDLIPAIRLTPRPASVAGVKAMQLDLNGTWKFNPAPPAEFWAAPTATVVDWKDIQVPGEWTMQGFKVEPNVAAGYRREFSVPQDWNGQRVKLRCDAVYSDAKVWINGQEAGSHIGGFTPFELDVTKFLKPGANNTIAVAVKNESLADTLASGTHYAAHPLGGIPRKIYLFAVPDVNIADIYVQTEFDLQFVNATLIAQVQIANDSAKDSAPATFDLSLLDSAKKTIAVPAIKPGQTITLELRMPVASPRKWDSEHPNLYTVTGSLKDAKGTVQETISKRIGFRQVEVRGNQLFVNNAPVKLRGVCRHETHPLLGRATTPEMCRNDVELFRAMNVNHIRTSHYPPQEEFIDACNELGMFVELEAPFVWVTDAQAKDSSLLPLFVQAQAETTLRDRSEPSVIMWSIGNESFWGRNFEASTAATRKLDRSRPCLFDGGGPFLWGNNGRPQPQPQPLMDIDAPHYPGLNGLTEKFGGNPRPTLLGEYAHLNCYNRRQFMTDPGLRDLWGEGIAAMWECMLSIPSCLGGNVWAGIDDFFFMPGGDAVGYGNWGPLDGWRRAKPEYWHLKKIYSPVHITVDTLPLPITGNPIRIPVENRNFFSPLSELRFEWAFDGKSGAVAKVDVMPGAKGELLVPISSPNPDGKTLELKAFSPLGFMVDAWRFTVGTAQPALPPAQTAAVTLAQTAESIVVQCGEARWLVDAQTGLIQQAEVGGKIVLAGGPALMLIPLVKDNQQGIQLVKMEYPPVKTGCSDWHASKVEARETSGEVEIEITGEYAEAQGRFLYKFTGDGRLTVDYDFKLKAPLDSWQLGVVLDLPRTCDTLSWKRKAQWSYYPDDHIGRAEGSAKASTGKPMVNILGPHTQPDGSWSLDETEMGSNDFCSMKRNVIEASLRASDGSGLRVIGGGTQHTRCWLDGDRIRLLVANYANAGQGICMNEYVVPFRPLRAGDTVAGKVVLEALPSSIR
ncbi:MAG: hypothetical protein K9M54_06495 [Kiritimatiellales bacterium]|nr:hypothetical protein [Kiritimatiellales bacterium]